MANEPRGLRNKNPGNLRHSKTHWMGQTDEQPDPDFVTFEDAKYGIRALYITLRTYQLKHGLHTIEDMIHRWAPPSENDTGAYVKAVAAACGVRPDQQVDLNRIGEKLVAAIIRHENGTQPYGVEVIRSAINLA